MGIGDEDRCECAQRSNDREGEELMVASELILGEPAEIGHVDGQRGEKPDDSVEAGEYGVGGVHVSGSNLHLSFDERTATAS